MGKILQVEFQGQPGLRYHKLSCLQLPIHFPVSFSPGPWRKVLSMVAQFHHLAFAGAVLTSK